ncbi:hypothetical protein [Aeoliella sp.]|uniref:hypothetical protein n=1 Tax=Aeoliella sp. TaxID=2795800 RepID=UPI003CCC23AB
MIDIALRTLLCSGTTLQSEGLIDCSAIGSIQQSTSDETAPPDRIMYYRTGAEPSLCLNGEADIQTTSFDIECISNSIDLAMLMAAAVKGLNGYSGTVGGVRIFNIDITDHSDDYEPKSSRSEGIYIASLFVEMIH